MDDKRKDEICQNHNKKEHEEFQQTKSLASKNWEEMGQPYNPGGSVWVCSSQNNKDKKSSHAWDLQGNQKISAKKETTRSKIKT